MVMAAASSPAASCSPTNHKHPHPLQLPSYSSCCRPPAVGGHAHHHLRWRRRRGHFLPPSALPDPQAAAAAAALLAVAGTVGVAATLMLRSSSPEQQPPAAPEEEEEEECPECGGTGLCGRCNGEGFVFKQLSEETATKARKAAKNMATRYTAGLPTKWTYCNKCSSTRSCTTCRGSGTVKATPATSIST
ncbi:unnamed protein product [Urochloa humidicola]